MLGNLHAFCHLLIVFNIDIAVQKQTVPGPEVRKLEYSLRLKIKRNDWLLADMCPQAANDLTLF